MFDDNFPDFYSLGPFVEPSLVLPPGDDGCHKAVGGDVAVRRRLLGDHTAAFTGNTSRASRVTRVTHTVAFTGNTSRASHTSHVSHTRWRSQVTRHARHASRVTHVTHGGVHR